MDLIFNVLTALTTLVLVIYAYFQFAYQYWEKRNFPFLPPKFPLGNSNSVIKISKNFDLESMEWYDKIKERNLKFAGIFYAMVRPVLVVIDPSYIKDILTTDFHHFVDRGFFYNEKSDPISAHLFAVDSADWRPLRTHLTSTFTSGKMKMMFPTILKCSDGMVEALNQAVNKKEDLEMREFLACFTTDVVGACAYGLEANSFSQSKGHFRQLGKTIFKMNGLKHYVDNFITANSPSLSRALGLRVVRKDVTDQLTEIVMTAIRYREQNQVIRPDFLQLVMNMEKEGLITMDQLLAQVFVFFIAGHDTSTSAMNLTLYELARNPVVQEKLRKEILTTLEKDKGEITYENIKEMKYLQQVLDETLRIWPSVPNLTRNCIKDYKLRDTDLVIEKGTPVLIPLISVQRDEQYFPDPLKFDPDRFSPENKNSIRQYSHFPFGEGPRNCIGLRFGSMQYKVGIITILRNFRVRLSPKMTKPLELNPKFFLLTTKSPLYLTAERI